MKNNRPAIVVVAYNRPKSLSRLLESIAKASYPSHKINLIISIDFSENNQDVVRLAENFEWQHGKKKVLVQSVNLGLKKHILQCGDFTQTYGEIVILEDDLYVSPNFYDYTSQALRFSGDKDYVGGIALYNHKINVHTGEYFTALEDGFDNWYFQFACSWGQAWSANQWQGFKKWLTDHPNLPKSDKIPKNVSNWSDKSWLKFYIAYLVDTNRYFLYPKVSLSTNFNDSGTHVSQDSTTYQVELFSAHEKEYKFSELKDSKARYDAFFESESVQESLGYDMDTVEVDLYGYKPMNGKQLWLTSKQLNYKIVQRFTRSLKPIECNILANIPGNELFLYDIEQPQGNTFENKRHLRFRRIIYSAKVLSYRKATVVFRSLIWDRVKQMFSKN
ncbi:MAG: glycosyltransferase family A protein [Bacteroidota bacterium]